LEEEAKQETSNNKRLFYQTKRRYNRGPYEVRMFKANGWIFDSGLLYTLCNSDLFCALFANHNQQIKVVGGEPTGKGIVRQM
jgi:hypothetical protein